MAADRKIPPFAQRQFFLDQQPQTVGNPIGDINSGTANASQAASQSVSNIKQYIVDSVLFNTFNFSGSFYLSYNPARCYLLVQNSGGAILYLAFNGTNGSFTSGLQIAVGGYYEPFRAPINVVAGSGSAGFVIEGVASV